VPVLARAIELAGIPTVTVTMMPDVADRYLLSRVVGVEFPFGHAFGMPNDQQMQLEVARAAVDLLGSATGPEERLDIGIEWPLETKVAYRDWQPSEPSPIVAYNLARRAAIEERRG
jgi:hypothetical protein